MKELTGLDFDFVLLLSTKYPYRFSELEKLFNRCKGSYDMTRLVVTRAMKNATGLLEALDTIEARKT